MIKDKYTGGGTSWTQLSPEKSDRAQSKTLSVLENSARGPCMIIGNGPSLNKIPLWVPEQYPTFACNFFPYYEPRVLLDYLVMIDRASIQNDYLWDAIRLKTKTLCFERWIDDVPSHSTGDVFSWANRDDLIPGFKAGFICGACLYHLRN